VAESRKERRRAELARRRLETKARLAAPVTPPKVPVALPWRRRGSPAQIARQQRADDAAWSTVMSGDASDLEGGLLAAAAMVHALGPVLRGRR